MSPAARRVCLLASLTLAASPLLALSPQALAQPGPAPAPTSAPASANGIAGANGPTDDDIAFARRLSNAFQSAAAKVEPAVVQVNQLSRTRQVISRDIFGRPTGLGKESLQPSGLGSGVIVSPDGFIVTNSHVVERADQLRVRLADGRELEARLIGRDALVDLAVLKIDADNLPYAEWADSDTLRVGEWVIAVGSPFGFSRTVTAGIVSARGRSLTPREDNVTQDFIQTDAAINPGNSGGPLLDLQGRIVGINTAIATRSGGYEGLGFAIPANMARAAFDNIRANGRVVRGYLGVQMRESPRPGPASTAGVTIDTVQPGTPAETAGLRPGDVILRFQGRALDEPRLRNAIALTPPGTTVSLDILRDGQPLSLSATLGDWQRDQARAIGGSVLDDLGVVATSLNDQWRQRLRYRDLEGVLLLRVLPETPAARAELREGDVIVAIGQAVDARRDRGRRDVTSPEDLLEAYRKFAGSTIRLFVVRDGMQGYVDLNP